MTWALPAGAGRLLSNTRLPAVVRDETANNLPPYRLLAGEFLGDGKTQVLVLDRARQELQVYGWIGGAGGYCK